MKQLIKKIPRVLLSLVSTVILYFLLFAFLASGGGDESNNPNMALGAFLAMTAFIHFPISWFVMNMIIKSIQEGK